jgi:hypothetical protein
MSTSGDNATSVLLALLETTRQLASQGLQLQMNSLMRFINLVNRLVPGLLVDNKLPESLPEDSAAFLSWALHISSEVVHMLWTAVREHLESLRGLDMLEEDDLFRTYPGSKPISK